MCVAHELVISALELNALVRANTYEISTRAGESSVSDHGINEQSGALGKSSADA